ncbi:MAG: RNA methyltransferase [Proteobacteria bacterium]|nr:RNA methyltransferase [Pseudomonadota bacterium]
MSAPVVILVRPQLGENIGAVARAMSNFGLSELRLVSPRDGWPNKKAAEMAAGAAHIIEGVNVFKTFADSLAGIQHSYATTARPRDMEKTVLEPPAAMAQLVQQRADGWASALVFGPERTGLENDEVSLCDTLITIPTSPQNSSLNLAQASVIVGYEWWKAQGGTVDARQLPPPAPREEMMGLLGQLEEYLDTVDYYRVADKKPVMWQNVQTMMLRGQWSSQEVRSMRGLLRAIWEKRRLVE